MFWTVCNLCSEEEYSEKIAAYTSVNSSKKKKSKIHKISTNGSFTSYFTESIRMLFHREYKDIKLCGSAGT